MSALSRRHREATISTAMLDRLIAATKEEFTSFFVVELSPAVVHRARNLLLRHPLRAGDAIQLGSCLVLRERLQQPVQFLAFDQRLNDAAEREGLKLAL